MGHDLGMAHDRPADVELTQPDEVRAFAEGWFASLAETAGRAELTTD